MINCLCKNSKILLSSLLLIFLVGGFVFISDVEARRGCCSHHGGVVKYLCPDGINYGYRCGDGSPLSGKCAPYYPSCPKAAPYQSPSMPSPSPKPQPVSKDKPKRIISQPAIDQTRTLVVGSFNLEWLGDKMKARNQKDVGVLASYIRSLEADILCCQEINPNGDVTGNGVADWTDLLNGLSSNYKAKYGTTGKRQHLAILWRSDRVVLSDFGELRGINRESVQGTSGKTFPRLPYTAFVKSKAGGVDFRIITVHLYYSDDKARYAEANRLRRWLKDYLITDADKDVLLIGDFNTKSLGGTDFDPLKCKTVVSLESPDGFTCISKAHVEFTTPKSKQRYDHAFLSKDLLDEEYAAGSWDVRREACEAFPDRYLKSISNHCPVTLRIDDQDNDNDPAGDWGDAETASIAQASPATINKIYLKDGRVIECDMGWMEGDTFYYRKYSGKVGISLKEVDIHRTYREAKKKGRKSRQ